MKENTEPVYLLHDLELVDMTGAGNQEALDEISNRYRLRLYETALAMLFSHEKAEQAVEHTLQELPLSVREFKNDSLLLTWLCRRLIRYILNNGQLDGKTENLQTAAARKRIK